MSPSDSEVDVTAPVSLLLTFNEPVSAGSTNTVQFIGVTTSTTVEATVSSITGSSVTVAALTLSNEQIGQTGQEFTVVMPGTVIQDASNNAFGTRI